MEFSIEAVAENKFEKKVFSIIDDKTVRLEILLKYDVQINELESKFYFKFKGSVDSGTYKPPFFLEQPDLTWVP